MDNPNGAEKQEETVVTPQVESPATENETTPQVPETAEKPVETPDEPKGELIEKPSETDEKSETGRAFAEMRHEIKNLKKQLEEKQTRQSSFDNLQNIKATPQFQRVDPNQFVDPATGNFNRYAYDVAISQANQMNVNAASQQAKEAVEMKFDEYQTRQKHPALNTNKRFERAVASEYQARLLETIGDPNAKTPTIMEIADELSSNFTKDIKTVEKEVTQKVQQQLTEKERGSLSAAGRSQPGFSNQEETNRLRVASRRGDSRAIMERFKRIRSR